MLHMLDTDTCNYIVRRRPASVVRTLQSRTAAGHEVCMSVVTWFELMNGVKSKGKPEGGEFALQIRNLRRTCDVVEWNFECERRFAALSAAYARKYPVSNFDNIRNDVMIASHALALGAVVVTNNERDFARIRRVGGPVWENWVSVSR
ncbi:MAG: type II toxin-antitoxin system VapC family toxin [Alphaproteobacteria bacterium]|nr:type II toxin-antitoxin system VapC family toxin [Alphaproteobacteria bacterium]MDA8003292.1 type II toxin-antitoxin system VapC family toxin [Alphaproteobacteria bacterium]